MINAILAVDSQGGIGLKNDLPWPFIKEDMQHFVNLTKNNTIVMGRNTWESLPKKPLPNRTNIVVSSKPLNGPDKIISNNLENELINLSNHNNDVFIIGGSTLLKNTIHMCTKIFLTRIEREFEADTFINLDTILSTFRLEDRNTIEIENIFNNTLILHFETWKK